MTEIQLVRQNSSSKLLIALGILWLILASVLLVYQLSNPPRVEITWDTATEQETAGFYLYRSQDPQGEFILINENDFINSRGSPVSGASYRYVDDSVVAGETYYYILEEVETDSSRRRYEEDMFAYTVPTISWWAIILTAGSVVVGLALLLTGLKEIRNL